MHPTEELLAMLGNWLSPGELSSALRKILRVPEAWAQLHSAEYLAKVQEDIGDQDLTLNSLKRIALKHLIEESDTLTSLDDLEDNLHELVDEIAQFPLQDRRFVDVAVLSFAIEKLQSSPEVINWIVDSPVIWRSPLACLSVQDAQFDSLFSALVDKDPKTGILLCASAFAASLPPDAAGLRLMKAANGRLSASIFEELLSQDPTLAQAIIDLSSAADDAAPALQHTHRLEALMYEGLIAGLQNQNDLASEKLEEAMALSKQTKALILDRSAGIASATGDLEQEIQDREDANAAETTPQRRAALALSLIHRGAFEDAQELLPAPLVSIEEEIVAAAVEKNVGDAEQVKLHYENAVDLLREGTTVGFDWMTLLLEDLIEFGEIGLALEAAEIKSNLFAQDVDVLIEFAELTLQAGDAHAALNKAYLAFALEPQSIKVRRILAMSLEQTGDPAQAIAHWNELAQEDMQAVLSIARCALEAEFFDLAIFTAESLIDDPEYSLPAKILIGRAFSKQGDFDSAFAHLEAVTQEAAHSAKAWIALAECYEASGNHAAAGQTISAAIQLNPNDAQLNHAYSLWLEDAGRLSEALEAAKKAYKLDSKNFDYQIAFGNYLTSLGHHHAALPILVEAAKNRPADWRGLDILARTHQALEDIPQAYEVITGIKPNAHAQVQLTAAKIALTYAAQNENHAAIHTARNFLNLAGMQGLNKSTHNYWMGFSLEIEGENEQAREKYQDCLDAPIPLEQELILPLKLGIARTAIATNEPEDAVGILNEARALYPNAIAIAITLSEAHLASGNNDQALTEIEEALKANPLDMKVLAQITKVSKVRQSWGTAIQAVEGLVEQRAHDPQAWMAYASTVSLAGEIDQARTAVAKALQLGRKDAGLLAETSRLMQQMGRPRTAFRFMQRAASQKPNDFSLLQKVANLAEQIGEIETAREAWKTYAEANPEDRQGLLKAADYFWSAGDRSGAFKIWKQAHRLQHDYAPLYLKIARAHFAEDRRQKGIDWLAKSTRMNSSNIPLLLEAAHLSLLYGENDFAFSTLQNALRQAADRSDVLIALAECFLRMKEYGKAGEVLNSLPDDEGDPALVHILAALVFLKSNDLENALNSFAIASGIASNSEHTHALRTEAAIALGSWDEAVAIPAEAGEGTSRDEMLLAELHARIRAAEVVDIYDRSGARMHAPRLEKGRSTTIQDLLMQLSNGFVPGQRLHNYAIRSALLSNPQDSDSLQEAESLAQTDPSGQMLEAVALAYWRSGQPQTAIETVAKRDDIEVEGTWFDLIAGLCQSELGDFSAAEHAFSSTETSPAFQPLAKYFSANNWLEDGNRANAIADLNTAVLAWSNEPAWQFQLGNLYYEAGDPDSAVPHLHQAVDFSNGTSAYGLALARALRDSGHLSQSLKQFKLAVDDSSSDGFLWSEVGDLSLAVGDIGHAEHCFKLACSLMPSNQHGFVGASRSALAVGDLRSALEHVKAAHAIAPKDPDVLVTKGQILAKQGKTEKALSNYAMAIAKVKDPLPIHIARSRLLIENDRSVEAISELEELLNTYDQDEELWCVYAEACEAANDLQESMRAVGKALSLSPMRVSYRLLLGRLSRKAGHLDRALDELTQLEALNPTSAPVLCELGRVLEERRQVEKALEAYLRAIASDPELAMAYFRAGVIEKQRKNYTAASDLLRQAAQLSPNNLEFHHQLAAVRALELVHGGMSQMAVST